MKRKSSQCSAPAVAAPLESLEPRTLFATLSVTPSAVANEGDEQAMFIATLSEPLAGHTVIEYRTVNGTARAGKDFEATRSSTVIPAGQTSVTFGVDLVHDQPYEPEESFALTLKPPRGVALATRRVTASIVDDEPLPTLYVRGTSATEGPHSAAYVTMSVNYPTAQTARISYRATSEGSSATAGLDFRPLEGTVVIRPNQEYVQIRIPILDDDLEEGFEWIHLQFTHADGADIGRTPSVDIGIGDDEPATGRVPLPTLSLSGPVMIEEGTTLDTDQFGHALPVNAAEFVISVARPTGVPERTVEVNWGSVSGTADIHDYEPTYGELTFFPGETSKTVSVPILADTNAEDDELFKVMASASVNVTSTATLFSTVTILNDDGDPHPPVQPPPPPPPPPPPTLTLPGMFVGEDDPVPGDTDGVPGERNLAVGIFAGVYVDSRITVDYVLSPTGTGRGHATPNVDYIPMSGTLVLEPGDIQQYARIPVIGDNEDEGDETFLVTFSNLTGNAVMPVMTGTCTIYDDDDPNPFS